MNISIVKSSKNFDFYSLSTESKIEVPLMWSCVSAGFPSPAEDYIDLVIDLNKELIKNPSATFLARVRGLSMIGAGIKQDDILIVDKSLAPQSGKIAVCYLDGEFTLKRLKYDNNKTLWLIPENKSFEAIRVDATSDFEIWGMVTYVIQKTF